MNSRGKSLLCSLTHPATLPHLQLRPTWNVPCLPASPQGRRGQKMSMWLGFQLKPAFKVNFPSQTGICSPSFLPHSILNLPRHLKSW